MAAAMQANLPTVHWFYELLDQQQAHCLAAITKHPKIAALADLPRAEWFRLLCAFKDLEHHGMSGVRALALAWCKCSPRFKSEADFDRDWNSIKVTAGGITVGTLLEAAKQTGVDLSPWRDAANTNQPAATAVVQSASNKLAAAFGVQTGSGAFLVPLRFDQSNLHPVEWIAPWLLLRGEISVLAG
jgi:hypothetical protein